MLDSPSPQLGLDSLGGEFYASHRSNRGRISVPGGTIESAHQDDFISQRALAPPAFAARTLQNGRSRVPASAAPTGEIQYPALRQPFVLLPENRGARSRRPGFRIFPLVHRGLTEGLYQGPGE